MKTKEKCISEEVRSPTPNCKLLFELFKSHFLKTNEIINRCKDIIKNVTRSIDAELRLCNQYNYHHNCRSKKEEKAIREFLIQQQKKINNLTTERLYVGKALKSNKLELDRIRTEANLLYHKCKISTNNKPSLHLLCLLRLCKISNVLLQRLWNRCGTKLLFHFNLKQYRMSFQ